VIDRYDLLFRDQRHGVVNGLPVIIGKSHKGRNAGHVPGDPLNGVRAVLEEVGFEDEVFRRITAYGKLGKVTMSAFCCPAFLIKEAILAQLPSRSPTVVLIWACAILKNPMSVLLYRVIRFR